MAHPVVTPRTYFLVYGALLLLTLTTVLVARYARLGALEVPVALGIASVKTVLVGLFFMHLWHSTRLTYLAIAGALLFLAILYFLTEADYWTRPWAPERGLPTGLGASQPEAPARDL